MKVTILKFKILFIRKIFSDANICSGVIFKHVPHPETCRKYYVCLLGMKFEKHCFKNFGFAEELRACVPMRKCRTSTDAPTEETTTPSIEETTVEVETTTNNVQETEPTENMETTITINNFKK